MVPFDTLKFAQTLERAGFSRQQAYGFTEALVEAMKDASGETQGEFRNPKPVVVSQSWWKFEVGVISGCF